LDGGDGDDLLVGDNYLMYSPLFTGLPQIDTARRQAQQALDNVLHSLRILGLDFRQAEVGLHQVAREHQLHVGHDLIRGGAGTDTLIGDNGLFLNTLLTGLPVSEERFVAAALEIHRHLRDVQQAALDLDYVLFQAHSQVLRDRLAAGPEPLRGISPEHHLLFVGNDQMYGDAGDDLIIGDYSIILTTPVTGWRLDQIELASPFGTAVWDAARTALTAQQAAHAQQREAARQLNRNLAPLVIDASALAQLQWDFDYPLDMGNDVARGNQGDDVLVGDFGIFVIPSVLNRPANVDEDRQLDTYVKRLLSDIDDYLTSYRHQLDYSLLKARYERPYYGERGGSAKEVPIRAGNDHLYGDEDLYDQNGNDVIPGVPPSVGGNDVVLGDVASMLIMSIGGELSPPPDAWKHPGFELKHIWRDRFEVVNHYNCDHTISRLNNDWIWGGPGNDLLYGQFRDDVMFGNAGSDLVFGGDGGNDLVFGGPQVNPGDVNDVRVRGDDWPKLGPREVLQTYVAQAITAVFQPDLRHTIEHPPTPLHLASMTRILNPGSQEVLAIEITFSEPVVGLDLSDLRLYRNGQAVAFSGTTTLSTVDQVTWTLDNLSPLTAPLGDYRLELHSAGSNISGLLGNLLTAGSVLEWRMHTPWHNPINPYDVDGQNGATAIDVLLLINYLNANPGSAALPTTATVPPRYYDVNNDGRITPFDVLMVINFINRQSLGEPEGESAADMPQLVGLQQTASLPATRHSVAPRLPDVSGDGIVTSLDALLLINYLNRPPARRRRKRCRRNFRTGWMSMATA
jgi:Ca2+-binding RTX toxin-like protein